jgi:hypothetical protein
VKCPQFCVFPVETELGETAVLESGGWLSRYFLRRVDGRSGLIIPTRRKPRDHNPIIRRMRLDW